MAKCLSGKKLLGWFSHPKRLFSRVSTTPWFHVLFTICRPANEQRACRSKGAGWASRRRIPGSGQVYEQPGPDEGAEQLWGRWTSSRFPKNRKRSDLFEVYNVRRLLIAPKKWLCHVWTIKLIAVNQIWFQYFIISLLFYVHQMTIYIWCQS